MLRTSNSGLILALVLIVALLVENAWIGCHNIITLRDQAGAVQHTHDVVQAIYNVLAAVKDAESGERGYLLARDDRYLEPYREGVAAYAGALDRLQDLLADNPEQLERLRALRSSADVKLRELRTTLDAESQSAVPPPQSRAMTELGLFEMNEVRKISKRMIAEEDQLLAQRSDAAAQTFRTAIISSLLSTAASIVLFLLAVLLIRRNISARTRAVRALSEKSDLLRTTLTSVVEGILVTDAIGRVTFMNPIAERLTGFAFADVVGQPLTEILDIRDEATRAPLVSRAIETLYESAPAGANEHRVLIGRGGAESIAIEESAAQLLDDRGTRMGVVLTLREVTEQRKHEKAIADARRYAEGIVDSIPDPVVILDPRIDVVSANAAYFELFRTSSAETLGHSLFESGGRRWNETALRALLDIGPGDDDVHSAELEHLIAPGDRRILRLNARRLHGAGSRPGLVLLAIRDVTEPRTNERRIKQLLAAEQENAGRLRAIAAASLTLNSAHSRDTVLDVLRGEARSLLGVETAVVVVHSDTSRRSSTSWSTTVVPSVPEVEQSFLSAPLTGRGGRLIGFVHLHNPSIPDRLASENDESILRQLAQVASVAIENANLYEELRDGDRRKDEFLATLAHELRNPLAPVRNSVQVLMSPQAAVAQRNQAVAAIDRQVTLLVRLVDDLLDVSRITRGKVVLKRELVDLTEILAQALEISRPLIHASGNTLSLQLPRDRVTLHADPSRIAQVLSNLLNNAAKYTESGGSIHLVCELEADEIVLKVRDNGIGIPPEMVPHIFDMFWQVDHSFERAQGGLGIGLTLVRQLVDLHGGSVSVRSEGAGRGSEFTVRLPATSRAGVHELPPSSVLPVTDAAVRTKLRILVVDDNHDSAESMALLLRLEGHVVSTAHDGLEALAAEEKFEPRIVLLDIGLPGKNGYDVAREIRARRGELVTLVAMTGWSQAEHRRLAVESGFDNHLVKPVDPSRLRELLAAIENDKP